MLSNPYELRNYSRDAACDTFNNDLDEEMLRGKGARYGFILKLAQRVLAGEEISLLCSCKPKRCHGDRVVFWVEILIEVLENPTLNIRDVYSRKAAQQIKPPDPEQLQLFD